MSWQNVRRLLCVRLDSLGDVLMTTPAMRAFRQSLGCRVTLLTSAAGAAVAPFVPEIDDVMVFAAPWPASMSSRMSPIIHERSRSSACSRAARGSIPEAGLRQLQGTAYSGTVPSGWCGQ